MTKINRITVHGFKSFAHKTHIPFENKYNCILGPNGAGKSNIGDAICFVLGRISAKAMRAEKAANLIFNGGKKKKPANNAYVEIAFDNSNKIFPQDADEIVVNRTVKKNGSSVYKINGKRSTRTEVVDLLSLAKINPEGYNVILQGDITRFVDMPATERRKVIEEICDVSIYEEKKHKSMLELNKVEDKLNNAHIILKERKTYLRELKKDRDQALKFKGLKDQIDSHKATHVHLQLTEKEKEKAKFDQEVSGHENKVKVLEKKIQEAKDKVALFKNDVNQINQEIEKKGEKEQLKVHRELEDLKVKIAEDKTRVSTLKDEINKIQQRKDQLESELVELDQKSVSFVSEEKELQQKKQCKEKELQNIERKIVQFKNKNKIESSQELEKEIETKDQLIEQQQEEVQKIRQQQQELLRDKDKLEYQLGSLDERISKVKAVEKENKGQVKQLQNLKKDFKTATLKLSKCLEEDSGFASQIAHAKQKLVGLQEEQAKLQARAQSVQASLSSNQAVQTILKNKTKFKGVHGTVAELGQVKKKYAQALGTAAGGRMQNVVVSTDKTAAECIDYLKKNKLGTASFIPLNKIKFREITTEDKKLLKQNGVHDFALNLVSFKSQFKKAFTHVFGNTLVVDDIATARNVGVGRIKMTTLEGDSVASSGVMRGGFAGKARIGFQEKDSLEELEKIEQEVGQLQGVVQNLSTQREANEQEISFLRNKKGEMEVEMIKLEKILHLDTGDLEATHDLKKELQQQLKEIDTNLSSVQKEILAKNKNLAEMKSVKQQLRSKVSQLRDPKLLAQLRAFEESQQEAREELLRIEGDLKNSSAQMQQILDPEKLKMQEIMKQHHKEETQFSKEITQLSGQIKTNEATLQEKEQASKKFYAKYRALFNKREKSSTKINQIENKIEQDQEKRRGHERELNLVSLRNAEIKAKLAGLQEEFSKYKKVHLLKNKSLNELQQEINKFEVMMTQMSAVNMKALEIYEEIETEFMKLIDKKKSLEAEKTDVLTLMNEIETKKTEHFMKTFKEANNNFQKIFSSLFKKGKAFLQLDNPESIFEGGLSVKVKLTGNRFMDIKSLSGGEKTLTALSFIFAIQEYQPASFYILDEIDAALDKHNSEKLAQLIRNYADQAQYILISHNDSLISEADTLFGVSMQDGVSKITSLKI